MRYYFLNRSRNFVILLAASSSSAQRKTRRTSISAIIIFVSLFASEFLLHALKPCSHDLPDVSCFKPAAHESYLLTRGYWRKQNPPVCGEILTVFRHACQKSFKILPHTGGICLRQCSRVTVSSADSSRVRQALDGCRRL